MFSNLPNYALHIMITPPYLAKGDTVGIVSTAKRVFSGELDFGISLLKSWGLNPVLGNHVYDEHQFFAGTDAHRLADLQAMLDNSEIKAIFFSKGSYGTLRIIDQVNFDLFAQHPKWLVGYSDITMLHNHVHNLGFESIHAVMLQGMPEATPSALESLRQALFGEPHSYKIIADSYNSTHQPFSGILTGGNLSILYSLSATPSDVDYTNKILFIEDIDEYLYHFQRMLLSLKHRGKFEGLKGLIVGNLNQIKEATYSFGSNEYEIVRECFNAPDLPIIFRFPAGHFPDNRALILGRNVNITFNNTTVGIAFDSN
jgi:muramoyltetrapeptide carboxypeptidase